MKKSFFAVAAAGVCATTLLVGCGDSSSSPSKSRVQKCANGLTDECLIGTWNLNGLVNLSTPTRDIRTPNFDYQANPGKLEFKADGTLNFSFPANAPADLLADVDCQTISLDTFSHQAPNYYPRLGFKEIFRRTFKDGSERVYFTKDL